MKTEKFDHGEPVQLSGEHIAAASRRRRIIVQYDACDPQSMLGGDLEASIPYRFDYIDEGGTQIDTIYWDVGFGNEAVWPSKVLTMNDRPVMARWLEQGVDWVGTLVNESHKRGLDAFWSHRISEVDGLKRPGLAPEKAKHQDWVLKTWWWQGLWNLAVPELRAYKVAILKELAELYDLDGFQIDFARHAPCLPVGRQWELRDHVTDFMRMTREMLVEMGEKRGRPFLLAARIPSKPEGCRVDGFDVETWMRLHFVDMLTIGSRSIEADVEGFRRMAGDSGVKLYPCLDDYHSTDGYRHPPIEFFRGVFGNWLRQGADGVVTFNWSCARPDVRKKFNGGWFGPDSQRQAYRECGELATLKGKDKIFAVERRGGYPYSEGFFNRNMTAQLPDYLAYDSSFSSFKLRMSDDQIVDVSLHVVVFEAVPGDKITVKINSVSLNDGEYDHEWKDSQIYSPELPPVSTDASKPISPDRKLLRVSFKVPANACRVGENLVEIASLERAPHLLRQLKVEKIEVHLRYG